jgi:cell division protein FtsL
MVDTVGIIFIAVTFILLILMTVFMSLFITYKNKYDILVEENTTLVKSKAKEISDMKETYDKQINELTSSYNTCTANLEAYKKTPATASN